MADFKEPYVQKVIEDNTSYPTVDFDYQVAVSIQSPSGQTIPTEVTSITQLLDRYNNGASVSKNNHITFLAAYKLLEAGMPLVICRAASGSIVRGVTNLGDEYYSNGIDIFNNMYEIPLKNEDAFLGSYITINGKKKYRNKDNFNSYWDELSKEINITKYADKIVISTNKSLSFSPHYVILDTNDMDNIILSLGNNLNRANVLSYNGKSIYNKGVSTYNFSIPFTEEPLLVYDEKDILRDYEYAIAFLETINSNYFLSKPVVNIYGKCTLTLPEGKTIEANTTNLKVQGQQISFEISLDEEMNNPYLIFKNGDIKYYIGGYQPNLDSDLTPIEVSSKRSGNFLLAILKILKQEVNTIPDNTIVDYREGLNLTENQVFIKDGKYYNTKYPFYSGENITMDNVEEVTLSEFKLQSYLKNNLVTYREDIHKILSDVVISTTKVEAKNLEDENHYVKGDVISHTGNNYEIIKDFTYNEPTGAEEFDFTPYCTKLSVADISQKNYKTGSYFKHQSKVYRTNTEFVYSGTNANTLTSFGEEKMAEKLSSKQFNVGDIIFAAENYYEVHTQFNSTKSDNEVTTELTDKANIINPVEAQENILYNANSFIFSIEEEEDPESEFKTKVVKTSKKFTYYTTFSAENFGEELTVIEPQNKTTYNAGQILYDNNWEQVYYMVNTQFTFIDPRVFDITLYSVLIQEPEFEMNTTYNSNSYFKFNSELYKVNNSFTVKTQILTKHSFKEVPEADTIQTFKIEMNKNLITSSLFDEVPDMTSSTDTITTYAIENPSITEIKLSQSIEDKMTNTVYYCGDKPFGEKLVNIGAKMTITEFLSGVVNNWKANSNGEAIYESGAFKVLSTSKLKDILYKFDTYEFQPTYTYKTYDDSLFGVTLKFPTDGAEIYFKYSNNAEDENDIDLVFQYGTKSFEYTFSMLEEKLNGYGVNISYNTIDNDYFTIVKMGGEQRLEEFTSQYFPSIRMSPTAQDFVIAYDKLQAKEEYQYNLIYDCANAHVSVAQKMIAMSNQLLTFTPLSATPGLDTIDKIKNWKSSIGITTCYQWFCPDTFIMSFGEFTQEMPASLIYMLQLNTNRLQNKEFTPIYGSINSFSYKPVHLWESKEEREELLGLRVNTIQYNPKNQNYKFNQNLTMQPAKTYMSDEYVVRLVTAMTSLGYQVLEDYDVAINDFKTRVSVATAVQNAIDNRIPKSSYKEMTIQCDEINNPPEVIEREELYCEVSVMPNRYSKYRKITGRPIRITSNA